MRAILVVLLLSSLAPVPGHAIVPCVKNHKLVNEFIDEDTGSKGRVKYRVKVAEVDGGATTRHSAAGSLGIVDVISRKKLAVKWKAVADTEDLAHASFLAAVESAVLATGGSAPGIELAGAAAKGDADFPADELLRMLSLIASSQGVSGGPDTAAAIADVARVLRIPLPELLVPLR